VSLAAALKTFRLAFAALGLVAIAYQFAERHALPEFRPANFFSFFTIQSNLIAIAVLAATATISPGARSRAFEAVRGAAVLYMTITGVVFAVLLSGLQESLQTATPWRDFVVHRLLPAAVVVDWLVDRRGCVSRCASHSLGSSIRSSTSPTRSRAARSRTGTRTRSWTSIVSATAASSRAAQRCSSSAPGSPPRSRRSATLSACAATGAT
jgi:hypothetical protein